MSKEKPRNLATKLSNEAAVEALTKACAEYKGTLIEHQVLQDALQIAMEYMLPNKIEKKPEEKPKDS